jgi:hypothetical protein
MTVSVIVPLYNLADYVGETLASAIDQTHEDIEIIVVNDASTDRSWGIVESYMARDSRIRGINLQVNRGLPAVRNLAIAESKGDFFLPLDADDWIDSRYLEKTLTKMTDGVGVVSTYMEVFGEWPHMAGAPGSPYPIFYPTKEQILRGNCLPVCSLVRKQAALDVGCYPEVMTKGSEDWAMWAGIICKTNWRVEVVPEHLFHYRTRAASMSRGGGGPMTSTMAPFEVAQAKIRELYAQ